MRRIKFLLAFFIASLTIQQAAKADDGQHLKNSISFQFGINGATGNSKSFGLAFLPPDFSYSRELFNNEHFTISTATFYDNIGVQINDSNFTYRVGQRLDFGVEYGDYTPYITTGLGIIRNHHNHQTAPVIGSGFLVKLSERFMMVNEVNFQEAHHQNNKYNIANLSTGLTYAF